MARFVENRIRCAIDPGKKNVPFKDVLNGNQTLIAYKDTTFAIEFALFNGTSLYDVSNIISLTLLVTNDAGTAQYNPATHTLGASDLNPALTLNDDDEARWGNTEDGAEHGAFEVTDGENALAEGDYNVTIYGLTAKGREVFGMSTLKIIDRKITNYLAAPVPGVAYATTADVAALNKQTVKYGTNPAGKFPIIVSADGKYGTALKTNNDPDGGFDPEQIPNPLA